MRFVISALAATLLALPAVADQMPSLIPAHDVSGTYLFTTNNGPKTMTVEYSKAVNVLRLNPQGGTGYILYDFTAKDAKMVMPQMQRYMDEPQIAGRAASIQGSGNGDDVSVAKGGSETIAGHDCTDYTATDHTKGTNSTLCVTDDGVLLKMSSSEGDSAVAQKHFQDQYKLPFTLVADTDGKVAEAFGVPMMMGIRPLASRQSFIVKDGKIAWNSLKAQTKGSAEEVQKALDGLN